MSGWSIDRIEEGWAVCEGPDDEMIRLEVSRLPAGVREGDCLFLDGDGRWQADPAAAGRNGKTPAGAVGKKRFGKAVGPIKNADGRPGFDWRKKNKKIPPVF